MTAEPISAGFWRLANENDPLPADEQRRLMVLAASGDEAATEAIIVTNMRFIIGQAMRLGRGQHVDALVQAGMIGMLVAIRRYRPERANGSTPITYAGYWVVLHMVNELGKLKAGAVRVPRRLMKAYRNGLLDDSQRAMVENSFARPAQITPNDACVPPPAAAVESKLDAAALMEHLGDRAQEIVRMRFLEDIPPADIARRFAITRQRVDQIVDESLAKMRRAAFFVPQASAWQTATATL